MGNRSNDRRSVMMLVSSMLIFGTVGIFRRFIPLSSGFLAFARGVFGGLFLLVFTKVIRPETGEKLPIWTFLWFAVSGAVMGVNWILLFEAYNHTTVAVATMCYYMQPTIVMLLSPILFRERLTGRNAVCAVTAIAGMILISGLFGDGTLPAGNLMGVLFGLGAAICYSTVVIMNKKISGADAYRKTTIQLFSAGLVMVPYLLLTENFSAMEFSLSTVMLLMVVCLIHTGLAYILYFGSMDGLKAQSIAILSYIDPVSALIFSALFLREPLSASGIIGAIMIIGSAVISEMRIPPRSVS